MRRTILVSSLVSSVVTVIVLLVAQRFFTPAQVHAQTTPGTVQATEFDVVSQNGIVLASLRAGGVANGNLTLYDGTGNRRVIIAGGGEIRVFDPDGATTRFRAGYTMTTSTFGEPPMNGVLLDPGGRIGVLPAAGASPP